MNPFYSEYCTILHSLHTDMEAALDALPPEALDWKPGEGMNSAAVLVVHATGAERFLIGDSLMKEPSNRDRAAEFRAGGMDHTALKARIHAAEDYIRKSLDGLALSEMEGTRIFPRDGRTISAAWPVLHALEHTAVHLGQLQLLVDLWKSKGS